MSILNHFEAHIASGRAVHDEGVPSVSMALIDRFGALTSHVITNGNETPDTLYQACSISEAITSLAVAKLYDDGVISYDDRIVDHVPPACLQRLGKTKPSMDSVTVGSLVSHRSGLSQHGFPGYSTSPRPEAEDMFLGRPPNTPRIRFASFPLTQLSYSGGGYLLLQIYLEHVLGRPFHEIMRTLVLQPLDMTRSTFADPDASEHDYAKAFATADVLGTAAPRGYHSFPELAAAETARAMLTMIAPNQPALSMAMGWGSDRQHFGHHGDNDSGYNTYLFGSHGGVVNSAATSASDAPSKVSNVAFAIMTNSVLGFPVTQKIISAVFHLDRWPPVQNLPGNFGSTSDIIPYPSSRKVPNDQSWKAWVGKWNDQWMLINDEGTPKLGFRDQVGVACLFLAAEAGNSEDGSKVASFVAESCNIAVRMLHQDGRKYLEIIQSKMWEVMDQQRLV